MKNSALLLFIALAVGYGCQSDTTTAPSVYRSLEKQFYKRLEGKIGHQPIVMHLHKFGDDVQGSYALQGKTYTLLLDTAVSVDSLVLYENTGLDHQWDKQGKARIGLKWTGTGFAGTHTSANGAQKHACALRRKVS